MYNIIILLVFYLLLLFLPFSLSPMRDLLICDVDIMYNIWAAFAWIIAYFWTSYENQECCNLHEWLKIRQILWFSL
jgi:hypothetical protein